MVSRINIRNAIITTLAVSGLAGISFAAMWRSQADTDSSEQTSAASEDPKESKKAVPVRTFKIPAAAGQHSTQSLTGTVRARYEHVHAFRVSGKILKRHIEVGQHVQLGQVLFELDPEDLMLQQKAKQAELEVAEAAVIQSTAEERRLLQLRKSNAVSESEYDRGLSDRDIAVGRLEAARKQLELANNQLNYSHLYSEASGTVLTVEAEVGQVVNPGVRVCTVAKDDELEAVVDIPENRLPPSSDLKARVHFWSLPGVEVAATLRELSPTADVLTRTYRGRFTLVDLPQEVKIGMTATVGWALDSDSTQIRIPSTSIFRRGETAMVWKVNSETGDLTAVPIRIHQYADGTAIVDAELQPGEEIVSAGVQKLDAGVRVRPWEAQL